MKTFQLRIIGKVQGVWYRASAKDKALSLGLKGKVWNERDGAVGVLVQGPDHNVSEFIEWCKDGPLLAEVDEVLVDEVAVTEIYTSFEIAKL
jgi:acylphosphatase